MIHARRYSGVYVLRGRAFALRGAGQSDRQDHELVLAADALGRYHLREADRIRELPAVVTESARVHI